MLVLGLMRGGLGGRGLRIGKGLLMGLSGCRMGRLLLSRLVLLRGGLSRVISGVSGCSPVDLVVCCFVNFIFRGRWNEDLQDVCSYTVICRVCQQSCAIWSPTLYTGLALIYITWGGWALTILRFCKSCTQVPSYPTVYCLQIQSLLNWRYSVKIGGKSLGTALSQVEALSMLRRLASTSWYLRWP